jgi:hypothetical protein
MASIRKNLKRKLAMRRTHHEAQYLKGPVKRNEMLKELQTEAAQRISRIETDFANGFAKINQYSDTVTLFGSARLKETHPYYQKAREIGAMLAESGYTVITGGGGGIMEAGNRGAFEAGGQSIGFNIQLPQEQALNPYTTDAQQFRYFFSRKVLLAYSAQAYIFFPGGYGTLDEFFEILTLVQTKKVEQAPIILVGDKYWGMLDKFIKKQLLYGQYTISPGDQKLYTITEDLDKIKRILHTYEQTQVTEVLTNGTI